jgi:hypothetical protein
MRKIDKPVKFIHWDFYPELVGDLSEAPEINLVAGVTRNSDTHKPTGFYFRWTLRLTSSKGLFLSCIGEDTYAVNIELMDIEATSYFQKHSERKFRREIENRLEMMDIPFNYEFHFKVTTEQLIALLNELKS